MMLRFKFKVFSKNQHCHCICCQHCRLIYMVVFYDMSYMTYIATSYDMCIIAIYDV